MSKDILAPLRRILQLAVQGSGVSMRRIEDAIGLGHGNLAHILDGQLDIRVHHLVRLARFLSVPPADFLELAYGEAARNAEHRLSDWIGPLRPRFKQQKAAEPPAVAAAAPPPSAPALPGRDDLREMMRSLLREELATLRDSEGGGSGADR
jgi:transcriptional regulator with XRE-family HTH domain